MKILWTLAAGVALALGVALCTGAFETWRNYQDFAAQALHIDGTVSQLQQRNVGGSDTTIPIVQFKTQDGSIVHISGPIGSGKTYAVNEHVPVLYDPMRPSLTRLDDVADTRSQVLRNGAIGAPLLLIGASLLLAQWIRRRRDIRARR
jgi:hypothetical protein